jgi:hypothetical protein
MPAVSPEQQRLMGQAYAVKTGKLKASDIDAEYRDQIVDLAKNMKEDDLKDYAKTKHSDIKKKHVKEYYTWWGDQVAQKSGMYASFKKDETDPLVQSFMAYVEGKLKKVKEVDDVKEDFAAPAASVTNTPGMGNAVPAAPGVKGSGDTFGATSSKRKGKKTSKNYDEWLKIKATDRVKN